MTKDEIIRMARKAGFVIWSDTSRKGMVDWACEYDTELERFAALVAAHSAAETKKLDKTNYLDGYREGVAHEREACAKVCDAAVDRYTAVSLWDEELAVKDCAAAIRARGEK